MVYDHEGVEGEDGKIEEWHRMEAGLQWVFLNNPTVESASEFKKS